MGMWDFSGTVFFLTAKFYLNMLNDAKCIAANIMDISSMYCYGISFSLGVWDPPGWFTSGAEGSQDRIWQNWPGKYGEHNLYISELPFWTRTFRSFCWKILWSFPTQGLGWIEAARHVHVLEPSQLANGCWCFATVPGRIPTIRHDLPWRGAGTMGSIPGRQPVMPPVGSHLVKTCQDVENGKADDMLWSNLYWKIWVESLGDGIISSVDVWFPMLGPQVGSNNSWLLRALDPSSSVVQLPSYIYDLRHRQWSKSLNITYISMMIKTMIIMDYSYCFWWIATI